MFYRKYFGEDVAEAHKALQHLGKRAFPLLLQILGKPDKRQTAIERWRVICRRVFETYTGIKHRGYHIPREQAITALIDLQRGGCDLTPVMPEIDRLAKDSDQNFRTAAQFLKDLLVRARSKPSERAEVEPDGPENGSQPFRSE